MRILVILKAVAQPAEIVGFYPCVRFNIQLYMSLVFVARPLEYLVKGVANKAFRTALVDAGRAARRMRTSF